MTVRAPILRGSRQHDLFALTAERLVYDDAVDEV
jgi:DNA sulfur modification protein DndC